MKSFKKSIVLTACLLLVVTAAHVAVAQTTTPQTTIYVRRGGEGQPNIPVYCTQTDEIKYTSVEDVLSGNTLTQMGMAKFNNGINDRSKYFAYFEGVWHPCIDDCDGPSTTPWHFHCELPFYDLTVRISHKGSYVPNLPMLLCDQYGYQISEVVYTDAHGFVRFLPPNSLAGSPFYIAYYNITDGTFYLVDDEDGYALEFNPGIDTESYDYVLPNNSMISAITPTYNATLSNNSHKTFKWTSVPNASYYKMVVERPGMYSLDYEETVTEALVWINADPNMQHTWYWYVVAYDQFDNPITSTTDMRFIVVP
jgi:hypothetical protein